MAYGRTCPVCGATVDNNEYDYTKDMCKDCVAVQSTVRSNESNLSYCTKICGAYTMTKATNVEGLWVNGAWGMG